MNTGSASRPAAPGCRRLAVVIGASGYIGSHLVPVLRGAGWRVRATARKPEVLVARGWSDVDVAGADILDLPAIETALRGADVVFYMVHCMAAGGDFAALERRGARNLVEAANATGVRRIVYLGGLAPERPVSQHLRARAETGEILRSAKAEVVEIRAGMIVGAGSAAWEVIRDLVNHLPIMVTPRWVRSRSTPIALDNVLAYLIGAIDMPVEGNPIYEVGGAEVCTYEEMMRTYGALVGRRPIIIDVPLLTPKLSSYWLRLTTSVPTNIAAALIEGLVHDFIADDGRIRQQVPQRLLTFREAAEAAIRAERSHAAATRWVEGSLACRNFNPRYGYYAKRASGEAVAQVEAQALWAETLRFGADGDFGYANWLWRIRRLLDGCLGGRAAHRRRRHPTELRVGDVFGGWRVIGLEPPERLTLQMEFRAPGAGVLEFEIRPAVAGSRIRVTGYWHPAGVWGLIYWYASWPAHALLFGGLPGALARRAEGARRCG